MTHLTYLCTRLGPTFSTTLVLACTALGCSGAMSSDEGAGGGDSFAGVSTSGGPAAGESGSLDPGMPQNNTNVSLGGTQDVGFFRSQLEAGLVPTSESLDAAGFFAEHHSDLPPPNCGERVCLQPMVAVMSNLTNGNDCTMLQLGLNSPLAADPGDRPPLSLAVVVDISGSMAGEKIQFVRDGLQLLIDGMKDGDELAIISYSDSAAVEVEMREVEGRRAELRETVRGLVEGGGTNLDAGLQAGYREVQRSYDSARQNRVILLSDGNPTVGITAADSIIDMSRAYNSDGIGLTTIGLGSDFNIDLMRNLALQADGNFYFLEDAGAVSEVFDEELSFFVVPIAFDLEVSVTEGAAYRFGQAYGTPFWKDSANGGSLEVPSVFLAHRESDADVTEDDGRRGGGSQLILELMPRDLTAEAGQTIAKVEVSFREPGTNDIVSDMVAVEYPYEPGYVAKEGYFEADDVAAVQKSFVMLNVFLGMRSAILQFEEGSAGTHTIAEVDNLIAAVEDYNEEVLDKDIELDLELCEQLRQNLVANGVRAEDPEPVDDPWPAD